MGQYTRYTLQTNKPKTSIKRTLVNNWPETLYWGLRKADSFSQSQQKNKR